MHEPREDNSLGPVMTFHVAGEWLAVRVEQMDRVAFTARLWPVPLTRPDYLGLLDNGQELLPVLQLGDVREPQTAYDREHLVVILHVRGESVGLVIDRAGRLCDRYHFAATKDAAPEAFAGLRARLAYTSDTRFWLIDTDYLWHEQPALQPPTPIR